ncbi:hypothetical protein ACOME3_009761 [Neoechinorhynchus agilis]
MSNTEQSSPSLTHRSSSISRPQIKDAFDDTLFAEYYDALFSGITQNVDPLPTSTALSGIQTPTLSSSSSVVSQQSVRSFMTTSSGSAALSSATGPASSSSASSNTGGSLSIPIAQRKVEHALEPFELGLDVNFYASKLNAFIGQAITRNIYILDISTGTGRVLAEILTLLSSSRIKQRLHFVGTDCHDPMLSRARLKIHKLLRSGAASGVDSISVNFIDADFDGIEKSVSPRRFHLIILALASFHRILTYQARMNFLTSICNLLLPDGRCIINLLPEKDIVVGKHQISFCVDENPGSHSPTMRSQQDSQRVHARPAGDTGRFRSSWRSDMMRGNQNEVSYFQMTVTTVDVEHCTDEESNPDEDVVHLSEKVVNTSFLLQSIKESNTSAGTYGSQRHTESHCSTWQRTVNVRRLAQMIAKADLDVVEMFDSFRGALCRQRSTNYDSAKVIVIGRKKPQQINISTLRTFR